MTRNVVEPSRPEAARLGDGPVGEATAEARQDILGPSLHPSFAEGLRFTCTRCGACCRHVGEGVGLRGSDIRRLESIGISSKEVAHPMFTGVLPSDEGVCSLISGESQCTVYESRPTACRLYPFYISASSDGALQLSVDHCPGVNAPGAELVDEDYVRREIMGPLQGDVSYLESLREGILSRKGNSYPMVGPGEARSKEEEAGASVISTTWGTRRLLWEHLFRRLQSLPSSLSPRDRLECLKADVVPWLEGELRERYPGRRLDEGMLEETLMAIGPLFEAKLEQSARTQQGHRVMLQTRAAILQHDGEVGRPNETIFHLRVGKPLAVDTRELLKLRPISPRAQAAEMAYLKEVVSREFVYGGVSVSPLPLRAEAALLFYLADALELMANAFALSTGHSRNVGVRSVEAAICEVDARILGIVQALGGDVAPDEAGPGTDERPGTAPLN